MKYDKSLGGRVVEEEKKSVNKKAVIAVLSVVAVIVCASIVLLSLWSVGIFDKHEPILYMHDAQKGYKEYYIEGENYPGTYAVMKVTDGTNTVECEIYLLEEFAPITVENFVSYAKSGFYNGTVIHRIVEKTYTFQGGSMVYADGEYVNKENGNSPIVGEFKNNRTGSYDYNTISHFPGSISMARTSESNSATSGFFISWDDYQGWNGDYAAFGFIVDKADVEAIKEMALSVEKDSKDYPETVITVTEIKIIEK